MILIWRKFFWFAIAPVVLIAALIYGSQIWWLRNYGSSPQPIPSAILDVDKFFNHFPPGFPPDPGEVGKETIQGIDSDHDGVRDDVQRWIYAFVPNEPKKQMALRQMARFFQQYALADNLSSDAVLSALKPLDRAVQCMLKTFDDTSEYTADMYLQAKVLNTYRPVLNVSGTITVKSQQWKWRTPILSMRPPVTVSKWPALGIVLFLPYTVPLTYAFNPCAGKGTMIFFVNGIFDNWRLARLNLEKFQQKTQPSLSDIPNLEYRLARVEDSWAPLQLAETVAQRGLDDFQHYWLWLYGLEKAPIGYVGEASSQEGKIMTITNSAEISHWRLGRMRVSRGQSKDPIEVDVNYFNGAEFVK